MITRPADSRLADAYRALEEGRCEQARELFEQVVAAEETAAAHEGLSWAALSLDDGETVMRARQRAYRLYCETEDHIAAARMAMWLAKDYEDFRGDAAIANGWRERARRRLEGQPIAPEHGWLPILECWGAGSGEYDPQVVAAKASEAMEVARRCGDRDLATLAIAFEGLALADAGRVDEGMKRLDEAAAAVLGGELDQQLWSLVVVCLLIFACERVRDFPRAAQWCEVMREAAERMRHTGSQGICRAHYGSVLTFGGNWEDAEAALSGAVECFEASWPPHKAEAQVHLAELRRRQGRIEEATALLERAAAHPLATLVRARLALDLGRNEDGLELAERHLRQIPQSNRLQRATGLEPLVRASTAVGRNEQAAQAVAELGSIAGTVGTLPLRATACLSKAVMASTVARLEQARACFEDAVDLFERAGMPFDAACARLELAEVLVALGRMERAQGEAESARTRLEVLGAQLYAERAGSLAARIARRLKPGSAASSGSELTARQIEILRRVAAGSTNKKIAAELFLSEKTVDRHLSNIFNKLGVSSRTAAATSAAKRKLI
jgi:LuxR family transcriptional regulator, maltose regulon positive regulatory protein